MSVTELRGRFKCRNRKRQRKQGCQCWPNPYESCCYPQKLNFDSSCDTVEIKCAG